MCEHSSEIWRDVVGYEGWYQVSDFGRVRSMNREVIAKNGTVKHLKGLLLKQANCGTTGYTPYKMVSLYKGTGRGNGKLAKVHILVATAFIGERPAGATDCRHLDGNGSNNVPSNLAWGTRKENMQDSVRHGTTRKGKPHPACGEKCHLSKLTAEQVREIRALHASEGRSFYSLGKQFGISQLTVARLIRYQTWKSVG